MKKKDTLFIQNQLFQKVQEILPAQDSLINGLSDVLKISHDSLYRRLRNETLLSIEETSAICKYYNISFDSIISNENNEVLFNYGVLRNTADFTNHMKFMLSEIEYFRSIPGTSLTYAAIDIPIFHHFEFPELTEFKLYYWLRAVINDSELSNKKFKKGILPRDLMKVCKKAYGSYKALNITEIWTDATINSLIKQIDFFWEAGVFSKKEDALLICKQAEKEILSIQNAADITVNTNKNYKLYFSEIEIGNNSILATHKDFKRAYLSYNTINLLTTKHSAFCNETETWLQNLIQKSTLISGASEKMRYQFFKRALENIHALKLKIQG